MSTLKKIRGSLSSLTHSLKSSYVGHAENAKLWGILIVVLVTASYAIVYNNVHTIDPEKPGTYVGQAESDTNKYLKMAAGYPVSGAGRHRVLVPWMVHLVPTLPRGMFDAGREINENWQNVVRFGIVNLVGLVLTGLIFAKLLSGFGFSPMELLIGVLFFLCSVPIVTAGGLPLVDAWFFFFLTLCLFAIQSSRPWILAIAFLLGLFTKELTLLIVPIVAISPVPRRRLLLLALVPGMVFFMLFAIFYKPEPEAAFWSARLFTAPSFIIRKLMTFNGALDLFSSFGLLWLPALYALRRLALPRLLRRWSWFIIITLGGIVAVGGNLGRNLFQTFAVVIPLALIGIRALIGGAQIADTTQKAQIFNGSEVKRTD